METEKTVIQAQPVTLSMDDQEQIVSFVKECWDKGKDERKSYMDHAKECADAYDCKMPPIESPELDWMSNECLPWAYDAADSWFAHIHSTTIPKQDEVFSISGRTVEDHPGADIMQTYLKYCFDRNNFAGQLGKAYKSLSKRNHTCLKVYWREDTTVEYQWIDEPVVQQVMDEASGMPMQIQTGTRRKRVPQDKTTYNSVWVDVIDINNFVMFPIYGDIEKTTRIHETYKYYEDFVASADKTNYFNLDQITIDSERESTNNERKEEKDIPNKLPKGLNIKEAWIHRVKIGDKVYRNYVATIVNDKVLVRFQPFPCGGKSPFVWMALRPDGDCLYGYGLNSKGLGILKKANQLFNCRMDEIFLTIHNPKKYYDDGVFNPHNVVTRPGAMIKMSRESMTDNLVPLSENPVILQETFQELAALKLEFESVTVPAVVKGLIQVEREHTATEQNLAQNNSSGKMHIDAYNINDFIIKPTLELSYQAIYDRLQFDESVMQEMQAITQPKDPNGMPMGELPVLPLPEVDIKIVGYQNQIRKQEQLQNLSVAIPQLAGSPAAKYLKWDNLGEDTLKLMDLDTDRLWMNEDERKQADQAEQDQAKEQQDLLVQQEAMKLQLQKEKQDQDFQVRMLELQLKQQQIECDCAAKQQQAEQNAQNAEHQQQMDHHGAAMNERQQGFNESQANKEPKNG